MTENDLLCKTVAIAKIIYESILFQLMTLNYLSKMFNIVLKYQIPNSISGTFKNCFTAQLFWYNNDFQAPCFDCSSSVPWRERLNKETEKQLKQSMFYNSNPALYTSAKFAFSLPTVRSQIWWREQRKEPKASLCTTLATHNFRRPPRSVWQYCRLDWTCLWLVQATE